MLSTAPDVCLATCLARGYKGDQGVDHQIAVKIILRYLKRTKEMFLGYGDDKEFDVKSYVDASFTPIRVALSKIPDTYNGATIWNSSKWNMVAASMI